MCQIMFAIIGIATAIAGFKAMFAPENKGDNASKVAGIILIVVGFGLAGFALIGLPLIMSSLSE